MSRDCQAINRAWAEEAKEQMRAVGWDKWEWLNTGSGCVGRAGAESKGKTKLGLRRIALPKRRNSSLQAPEYQCGSCKGCFCRNSISGDRISLKRACVQVAFRRL